MKAPKDKRTLEYKEWKKQNVKEDVGLGDVIEKAAKFSGIKRIVDALTPDGKDCGCDDRQAKANQIKVGTKTTCIIIPNEYNDLKDFLEQVNKKKGLSHRVVRAFTEELYYTWKEFNNRKDKNLISWDQQRKILIPVYAHLFAIAYKPRACCTDSLINPINLVFDTYETK
jgi:uncharacterized protein YfkK (UPF0435 family)